MFAGWGLVKQKVIAVAKRAAGGSQGWLA